MDGGIDRASAGGPLDGLTREQIRDVLARGWLTHDGMWFDQAARALGVGRANELNRAAIRAMAPFEVSRLAEALGVVPSQLEDAAAVARFVAEGISLVTPASVSGRLYVRAGADTLHWEWEPGECFAYKGMQRLGHLAGYECGVIYRVECWLEALGGAASGRAGGGTLPHARHRPLRRRSGAVVGRLSGITRGGSRPARRKPYAAPPASCRTGSRRSGRRS